MVEQINSEQAYINYVMKKLPEPQKGEVHTLQKGENLWNLAKRKLNKKNVKNQEISDYMLLIAKLNKLDTIEKMNSLKVSDKIYLPSTNSVSSKSKSSSTVANQNNKTATTAERSVSKIKELLLNDKTIHIEKMYKGYPSKTSLYHVYNEHTYEDGFRSTKHPLASFEVNNTTGEIKNINFDDQYGDKKRGAYDYEMDSDGNITNNEILNKTKTGVIDKQTLNQLHSLLKEKAKNSNFSY